MLPYALLAGAVLTSLNVPGALAAAHRANRALHFVVKRNTSASVTVDVPISAPSSAYTVGRDLVGLSIEGDRWAEWVGLVEKNEYLITLLENLADITGQPPNIRVGADSQDHTFLNQSVPVATATFPASSTATPYPEASNVEVSSAYYDLSRYLPKGTHVVWGVNLLSNDTDNAVAEAQAITSTFAKGGASEAAGVVLDAILIGNEPDLYANHGYRLSSTWTPSAFVDQWESFAQAIINATGLNPQATEIWFGAMDISSNIASWAPFSPENLFATGVLNSSFSPYIKTYSQHHYQSSVCSDVSGPSAEIGTFMNKATIRSNISLFDPDIAYVKSNGLAYIFGETNSISCHGYAGVSNTAAAALWAIDYTLQAVVHGISKLYFHDGIGYKYNWIQPVYLDRSPLDDSPASLPAHIQPEYYAPILIANFLGNALTTHITELAIPTSSDASSYISGYAGYNSGSGALERAVLVNLNPFLSTNNVTQADRPSTTVSLSLGTTDCPTSINVRRLKIGYADDTSGLSFGGISYETSDGKPSGKAVVETVKVAKDGTVSVVVSDSEAVLVAFEK
ncbi:hypothetical protein DL93DRAFT_2081443 [Clavulina sp. PMI_390]|nr:hypothetical protein DL93DRAFT_2081443 [Clavulina sp. PMI_390]